MTKEQQVKKVLVFGTFDGIHPGHLYFLNEAKKLGNLYISVASDESVKFRKWKDPMFDSQTRMKSIEDLNLALEVILGDTTPTTWSPIAKVRPDIVAIGYDQDSLEAVLKTPQEKYGFEIVKFKGYKEDELHSSIINKKL
jgi:FAD synthetase